jgi:hypothetical protein
MRLCVVLAVLGLGLAASPRAEAGGCGYGQSYSGYATYQQSYYQPTYAQTYVAPEYKVKEKDIYIASFVPTFVPTYNVSLAPAAQYSTQTTTTVTQAAAQQTQAVQAAATTQATTASASVSAEQITALTAAITALQQQVAANCAPATTVQAAPKKTPLEECQDRLQAAEAELQRLKAGQAPKRPPANQQGAAPAHVQILAAKCSSCHDAGNAADKGNGFVLMQNGQLAQMDQARLGKVINRLATGRMPPKTSGIAALTEAETSTVLAAFGISG